MELSAEQTKALTDIETWFTTPGTPQIYRLFGYAGTGKTTLAKSIAAKFAKTILRPNKEGDLQPFSTVQFAAYTGKAALVMDRNGCKGARTLHSLAYIPERDLYELKVSALETEAKEATPERAKEIEAEIKTLLKESAGAGLSFVLNEMSDLTATDLLIIDECSMVNEEMALDILSFEVKVLVLGDPAQLPPVGGEGYFINVKPDTLLTKIHRQAEGNPIIKLASDVRNYRGLKAGEFGDSAVIRQPTKDFRREQVLAADICIVGKNATRLAFNKAIRAAKNLPDGEPTKGDKVICLRNTPDKKFINGAIYTVDMVGTDKHGFYELVLKAEGGATLKIDGVHPYHFQGIGLGKNGELTGAPTTLTTKEANDIHSKMKYAAYQFDFAYAITCHKSQGSQWDNVYIKDESAVFRDSSTKWLYTAITRAAKRVVVEV